MILGEPTDDSRRLGVQFVHVDTERLLVERVEDEEEDGPPAWAEALSRERNGLVTISAFNEEHVVASLSLTVRKENVFVQTKINALYKVQADNPILSDGENLMQRIPEPWKRGIADQALRDLYPFARQIVHTASTMVFPVSGLLLAPSPPELGGEDRSISAQSERE